MQWPTALLLLTLGSLSQGAQPKPVPKTVGIVGGGASGMTAAYLLHKRGYKVTIIEKDSEVGGVARTKYVNGRSYDMATALVAGGTIAGAGIQPTLKEMIEFAGSRLVPIPDVEMQESNSTTPIFDTLKSFTNEQIKTQLLDGLILATQFSGCIKNNIDCVACGICQSTTETLLELTNRKGIPAFGLTITFALDNLGVGPAFLAPPKQLLPDFPIMTVVGTLRALGVTSSNVPLATPANIKSLLSAQQYYIFAEGYQTFFKQLVKKAKITVQLNAEVTALVKQNEEWRVNFNVRKKNTQWKFDFVLVTTAPQDAVKFLSDGPQKEVLKTAAPPPVPKLVFLASVSKYAATLPAQGAFYGTGIGAGTPAILNPAVGGIPKCGYVGKYQLNRDVLLIGCSAPEGITNEDLFSSLQAKDESTFGFSVNTLYHTARYYFPSVPRSATAWAQWATLQGPGLFFLGEAFSGPGVPSIVQYEAAMIPAWFPQL